MNILITGSAGFIGFHLCELLLTEGYDIIGIDNINDYYDQNLKVARINQLGFDFSNVDEISWNEYSSTRYSNYKFIRMDICDSEAIQNLFEKNKFDIVVNLAAQAGVRYSIENPSAYVNTNIVGFHNILEVSHKNDIKHVIYASSSSVYGFNEKFPFSEMDRVDYPVSMYAATKKSSELMAHTYSHLHKLPTTGIRFFTVYGPWGRPDMAPFLFTKAIFHNEKIKVFNNGDLFRDFTYISDIVNGVKLLIESKPTTMEDTEVPFGVYNIGNNEPVNLLEFISITESHVGKLANKVSYPMQPGDVYRTFADITALKKKVGYMPRVKINEGMKNFVNWYKEFYSDEIGAI